MRKFLLSVVLAVSVIVAYCLYPVFTLWRLDHALKTSDALALDAYIDWTSVQRNLERDLLNWQFLEVLDRTASVDGTLTCLGKTLETYTGQHPREGELIQAFAQGHTVVEVYNNVPGHDVAHLEWIRELRFLSPTHFAVQDPDQTFPAFRFVLSLQGPQWRLTRAVLDFKAIAALPAGNPARWFDGAIAEPEECSKLPRDTSDKPAEPEAR